jgi:hypothetical protein
MTKKPIGAWRIADPGTERNCGRSRRRIGTAPSDCPGDGEEMWRCGRGFFVLANEEPDGSGATTLEE